MPEADTLEERRVEGVAEASGVGVTVSECLGEGVAASSEGVGGGEGVKVVLPLAVRDAPPPGEALALALSPRDLL